MAGQKVPVMDGARRVVLMKPGDRARVRRVHGAWLGVDYDGYRGWVYFLDVTRVDEVRFRWGVAR